MSLFKRAFVRGVNDELIRLGLVRYSTKTAADEIADAVGDQMPEEPAAALAEGAEEMPAEPVSPETAAEVAATLIDSANKLVEETAGAGLADEGAPPMAAEEELKTSAASDLDTRAHNQGYAVMVKAAAEVKQATGSTIEGGDKGNEMTDSPAGETEMEAKNRPQGKYVKGVQGVGQTDSPAGRGVGVVGSEQVPAPEAPGATDEGTNTVVQQSKMGALRSIIQKVAMGTTIEGGDKGNTLADAAATTGEGKLEADRRPEGYAENSRGTTELPVTPAATVGTEQPHPDQPGESPAGSTPGESGNSVVEFSNESKTGAAADPFLALFKKTADETVTHLPTNLPEDTKIAHIRRMMGMSDTERNEYIGMLHKDAGATDDQAVEAAQKHASCTKERRRYSGNPGRRDRTRDNTKTAMPEGLMEALQARQGMFTQKHLSIERLVRRVYRSYRDWERFLEMLPRELADILERFRAGELDVHLDVRRLDPIVNRLVYAVLSAALFIGSSRMLSSPWRSSISSRRGGRAMTSVRLPASTSWPPVPTMSGAV